LCEPRMARIATVSPRNVLHIVPVVYIFDPEEGSFFISTGAHSVTVRNLRRNLAMTIIVDDDAFPFRAVMAEGNRIYRSPWGPTTRASSGWWIISTSRACGRSG
jgi:nitroimidazol reductase NimA-like FMN-containing flavoprotein (pyridoxamine 5'-phosphate oxidase superfamily)